MTIRAKVIQPTLPRAHIPSPPPRRRIPSPPASVAPGTEQRVCYDAIAPRARTRPTPPATAALAAAPIPRRRIRPKTQSPHAAPASPAPAQTPALASAKPKRRRGHAVKDEHGKYQATGNYDTGFARPPRHSQFDGTKPGPGRPKGSRSQASYLREEFDAKRVIRIDGVACKLKNRQVMAKLMVNTTVEKPTAKNLKDANAMAAELFPEERISEGAAAPLGDPALDEAVLRQLFATMRMGEAASGADQADPLRDLMRETLGADPDRAAEFASDADTGSDDPWSEGDWALGTRQGPGDE